MGLNFRNHLKVNLINNEGPYQAIRLFKVTIVVYRLPQYSAFFADFQVMLGKKISNKQLKNVAGVYTFYLSYCQINTERFFFATKY